MVLMVDLLGRGYFPKELPPPFNTSSFAAAMTATGVTLPQQFTDNPRPHRDSAWCNHNLVRTGGLRRHLGIPNPVHFYRLAEVVVSHWSDLEAQAKSSPYSLSKPTVGIDAALVGRAIVAEHDLSIRALKRAEVRSGARFLVRADVARCFPSIYTHSLPWALLGKAAAKAQHVQGTLKGQWQDTIDVASRSLNRSQTIGLPIGPDTSRLLAEVILSAIDKQVERVVPPVCGLRFVDDYEFATETRSNAEAVLNALQVQLAEYELALNGAKTSIIELPSALESAWTNAIRCFTFRDRGSFTQRYDLIGYFDTVFDLFKRFPEEGLLNYAIGRLRSIEIEEDNWGLLQNILGQCVRVEPACIPQVCNEVVDYVKKGLTPAIQLWGSALNQVICTHLPIGQASEAAWAMWLLKCLSLPLSSESSEVIDHCDDSVATLMGLGLADLGLGTGPTTQRFGNAGTELFENHWLLFYEASLQSRLGTAPAAFNVDPRFAYLAGKNVSFFNIRVKHPLPSRSPGGGGGGAY